MSYQHSSVYIVKIVDVMKDGDTNTWYVGPYGNTRADQVASSLETDARDYDVYESRDCTVEPLFSDDECLRVADYGRPTHGSLR
jgi:hypothetical protein